MCGEVVFFVHREHNPGDRPQPPMIKIAEDQCALLNKTTKYGKKKKNKLVFRSL